MTYLFVSFVPVPAPAAGSLELRPLDGQPIVVDIPIDAVDSVVTDDATQRVYLASSTGNAITAIGYDGSVLMTRTLASPSSLTVNHGRLYAVQTALGQIIEISPATLEPTVLISGLNEPMGLAFNGSNPMTSVTNPFNSSANDAVWEFQGAQLFRVLTAGWPKTPGMRIKHLFTFPEFPGHLYVSDGNLTYRMYFNTHVVGPGGTEFVALADGRMFVGADGLQRGGSARDPFTLEYAGSTWSVVPNWGYLYSRGITASRDVVVQHRADSSFDDLHTVELRVMTATEPSTEIRRMQFSSLGGTAFVTRDSSRVLFLEKTNGRQRLRLFPGVGYPAAPQAPGNSAPRIAAPDAAGATLPRTPAPASGDLPVKLRLAHSLWFDPSSGLALVADPGNGVVGVFGPTGRPLRSISGLAGVRRFASLNGKIYAHSWSGSVIHELNVVTGTQKRSCDSPGFSEQMVSAGGRLWFGFRPLMSTPILVGIDPVTCDRTDIPLSTFETLSEPVGDSFFVGNLRFNATTRVFSPGVTTLGYLYVLRDGTYIHEGSQRFSFDSNAPSGAFYPEGDQYDVSSVVPKRVAAKYGYPGGLVSIFQYDAPGTRLRRLLATRPYFVHYVAFRPGTNELWVAALNADTDEIHVGPFADAVTGALLQPDPVPRPASWPAALDPQLVVTQIAEPLLISSPILENPDPSVVLVGTPPNGSTVPASPPAEGTAVSDSDGSPPPISLGRTGIPTTTGVAPSPTPVASASAPVTVRLAAKKPAAKKPAAQRRPVATLRRTARPRPVTPRNPAAAPTTRRSR